MESHEDGIWTATADPAQPDLFSYYFLVEGTSIGDPSNPLVDFSPGVPRSLVLVPGAPPEIWEERDAPHGVIRQHWSGSRSARTTWGWTS
jgi:enterochelin esterase family protein